MKHFFRQIAIALFSTLATGAFAAAENGAEQRVEITAPSAAIAAAQVVLSQRDLDATYEMSSGRTARLSSESARPPYPNPTSYCRSGLGCKAGEGVSPHRPQVPWRRCNAGENPIKEF